MSIEQKNDLLLFGLTIEQLASKIVNRDKKLKNKFALWLQERLNFETTIKELVADMDKFDNTLKLKINYQSDLQE